MHYLRIFVRCNINCLVIYCLVVALYRVAAVGIVAAEFNRMCICSLGHDDALSKILVVCRNGRQI